MNNYIPLTDEEIRDLIAVFYQEFGLKSFAQAVERKVLEKQQ